MPQVDSVATPGRDSELLAVVVTVDGPTMVTTGRLRSPDTENVDAAVAAPPKKFVIVTSTW